MTTKHQHLNAVAEQWSHIIEHPRCGVCEENFVAWWNANYPAGTQVNYWKGARGGYEPKRSRTRTPARMLSGHTAVVWLYDEGACIALTHVEPLSEAVSSVH